MTDTERLRAALEWANRQTQHNAYGLPEPHAAIIRDFIERGLPFLIACETVHVMYHPDDHEATLHNVAEAHKFFMQSAPERGETK